MRIYNTLTRTLQPFQPVNPPTVTIYVCGPTVYDDPHLGHLRSAYVFDVFRRYVEHQGFHPRFVRNVTDVDDKIIDKARQEVGTRDLRAKCQEVSERYLNSYHAAMDRLGISRPDLEPRATEHIEAMLDLVSKLLIDGIAYEAGGDVYFSVRKFPAMVGCPIVVSMSYRQERESSPVNTSAIQWTLRSGKRPSPASHSGTVRGEKDGLAGTSNAQP